MAMENKNSIEELLPKYCCETFFKVYSMHSCTLQAAKYHILMPRCNPRTTTHNAPVVHPMPDTRPDNFIVYTHFATTLLAVDIIDQLDMDSKQKAAGLQSFCDKSL